MKSGQTLTSLQEEDEWEGEDWEGEENEETTDIKDESTAYLDFLSQQASKFNAAVGQDEDDDELEEESLLETPLDSMEPYGLFKQTLHDMSQNQPQFYSQLTGMLQPEEQQVIKSALEQAEKIQAQQQQQAGAQGSAAAGQANGTS